MSLPRRNILLLFTALVALRPTSAAAFPEPEQVSGCEAALSVEIPHPGASASLETDAGESITFVATERVDATRLTSARLRLPIEGHLTLSAPGHATDRFHLAFARATNGVIDLGSHSLATGFTTRLRTVDSAGDPVVDAAIHVIDRESRFPPRDPADRSGSRSFLDATNRIARTDATGHATIALPADAPRIAVLASGRSPVFATLDASHAKRTLEFGPGIPLAVSLRPTERGLLTGSEVTAYVDLGGVAFETRLGIDEPTTLLLDEARAVRVVVEARGFRTATRIIESADVAAASTPVTLDLEALPLAYATIEARDAATKLALPLSEVRLGRARAHPREYPDRVDFAPDWNSFRIGATEPALCAAPRGRVDLFAAAERHRHTIVRGLEFTGTREAPTPIVVDIPGALPVQGIVRDAATRTAIPGARIALRRVSRDLDDLPLAWKIRGTVGYVTSVATNANGRFRAECESYEALVAEVEADGYATTTFGPFPRESAHEIALDLARGHTLAGRVEGARPGDVLALLAVAGHRLTVIPLASDGTFRCSALAAGEYRAVALSDPRAALARGRGPACSAVERALETAESTLMLTGDRLDLVVTRAK